jgi:hypothetical protein
LLGDSQELSKQKWKPHLDALEEYFERNQDDDSDKFGLSQDQMNNVSQLFKNQPLKKIFKSTIAVSK